MMNGMKQIGENNKTFQTNLTDAISKIEDADIPELSNKLTQLQSKQQLLSSTLGLSNSMPQYLLSLIRG
jgi:flagellin-like hook-associated protein FlgL